MNGRRRTYRVRVTRRTPGPVRWGRALAFAVLAWPFLAGGCSSVGESSVPPTTRTVTVATFAGAGAPATEKTAATYAAPAGVQIEQDQRYGDGGAFDVYQPSTPGPHPLVVVFPGRAGGKALFANLAGAVAARGAVVVVPDYRARSAQPVPLSDLRCAVDVARAMAAGWNADPARLVLVGVTWGAVAAVGEGLGGPWQKTPASGACSVPVTAQRPTPVAIVGVVGDYAFYGAPGTDSDDYRSYSPYAQLAGVPPVPITLLTGTPDQLAVRPAVSTAFADAAKAAGLPVSMAEIPLPNLTLTGLTIDETGNQLKLLEPGVAAAGLTPTVMAIAQAAGL